MYIFCGTRKDFCHEWFHFVVFFKVDTFRIDVLLSHLESGSVDRLANLAGSGKANPEVLPSWMNEPSEALCRAVSARRA